MPLDDILDDIIEDKKNTENKETTTELVPEMVVTDNEDTPEVTKTEEIVDVNKEVEETPAEAPSDSEENRSVEDVVESIKKNIEIYNVVEDIKKQNVLDKSTAMEVFTMLPMLDTSLSNRLTYSPTKNNAKLIGRVLDSYNNPGIIEDKYSLSRIISKLIDRIKTVNNINVSYYYDKFKDWSNVKHIVVYNKKAYDLVHDPIVAITTIDDKAIMYEPYEGILTELYIKLWQSVYNIKEAYIDINTATVEDIVYIINNNRLSNEKLEDELNMILSRLNSQEENSYITDLDTGVLDRIISIKNRIVLMESVLENKVLDILEEVFLL